jgi:hypothetical protein
MAIVAIALGLFHALLVLAARRRARRQPDGFHPPPGAR